MSKTLPSHQPHCLGCGDQNPASMGLRLRAEDDRVVGEVTLDRRHEGAPGFAHGGAVATVLDDALGSVLFLVRVPAVTAKLEVSYHRPAFIGRRFDVEARVASRDGRKLRLEAELHESGQLIASASALFVEVDPSHFLRGVEQEPADRRDAAELPW